NIENPFTVGRKHDFASPPAAATSAALATFRTFGTQAHNPPCRSGSAGACRPNLASAAFRGTALIADLSLEVRCMSAHEYSDEPVVRELNGLQVHSIVIPYRREPYTFKIRRRCGIHVTHTSLVFHPGNPVGTFRSDKSIRERRTHDLLNSESRIMS